MLRRFSAAIAALFLSLALPFSAPAQDMGAPKAILVLDGSGSMWGQIDGVNKIVIAREVIGDLLTTLPAGMELGLMSYGHRRKGDCSDIEMLVQPGTDRAAISAAVNAINPKGKTPLSAAVIAAAEALRYTEDAATVILVSDGIETCEYDPCEVGRRLETAGVNFTAHVIGFDVADPAAKAQLQCLAEETGGTYRSADNAEELADALSQVAAAPPTPPQPVAPAPVDIRFVATDGDGGPMIGDGIVWWIRTEADGVLAEGMGFPDPEFELTPGTGHARALRLTDEAVAEVDFTVPRVGPATVTLILPEFRPLATLDAPASAPAGSAVRVGWTGPDNQLDFLAFATAGTGPGGHVTYAYTETGSPAVLIAPTTPGSYELRYVMAGAQPKVLATAMVEITEVAAMVEAPMSVPAGAPFETVWTGPGGASDFVTVVPPEAGPGAYTSYGYTENSDRIALIAPTTPGSYELRYVQHGEPETVLFRRPLEVTPVSAALEAAAAAPAGGTLSVAWTGPGHPADYLAITRPDDGANGYMTYAYAEAGSPLDIAVPDTPGSYELRYVLDGNGTVVLARQPLSVQ